MTGEDPGQDLPGGHWLLHWDLCVMPLATRGMSVPQLRSLVWLSPSFPTARRAGKSCYGLSVSCQFTALTQGGQTKKCRIVSMLILGAKRSPGHIENRTQARTQRALARRGGHKGKVNTHLGKLGMGNREPRLKLLWHLFVKKTKDQAPELPEAMACDSLPLCRVSSGDSLWCGQWCAGSRRQACQSMTQSPSGATAPPHA